MRKTDGGFSVYDAANVLCQLLKEKAAPDVEVDTFNGKPIKIKQKILHQN